MANSREVSGAVATRARIVLWWAENRRKKEIAELSGVSRPTVDLWLGRYAAEGIAGLADRPRDTGREQVPGWARAGLGGHAHESTPRVGAFSLVEPGAGCIPSPYRGRGGLAQLRGEAVAGDRAATAPAGHIQDQSGSGVRGEGRRHRGTVPGAPGRRGGALDRREDAGAGVGPDSADAADRV